MPNERIALRVELYPEKVDEYVALHDRLWPEVESAFREVGVRSLSLFLDGATVIMFIDYAGDRPWETALADYASRPRVPEWERLMAPFKRPLAGASAENGFVRLREIYRLE